MNTNVDRWLLEQGLLEYAETFTANDIDFATLAELDDADLKELGITSLGHRKKFMRAIELLNNPQNQLDATAQTAPTLTKTTSSRVAANFAQTTDTREVRHLTIMFCDLVGSTAMLHSSDTESVDKNIRLFYALCTAVIHEYGGHVAQFAGDGVLSYFGYPHTLEREVERAIQGAQSIIQQFTDNEHLNGFYNDPNIDRAVRIGIATGEAIIAGTTSTNTQLPSHERAGQLPLASGVTPKLAHALQYLAQPNTIYICDTTKQVLPANTNLIELGLQTLPGFPTPEAVWEIQNNPISTHPSTLKNSIFAGRTEELEQLLCALESAQSGVGQAVIIRGEAGVGKSRLLAQMYEVSKVEKYTAIRLACQPHMQSTPFYPITALLLRIISASKNDSSEHKRNNLSNTLSNQQQEDTFAVALLARLLGIANSSDDALLLDMSAPRLRAETMNAMVRQVTRAAQEQVVCLEVEDLHWADASTLEFLEILLEAISDKQFLLAMTARLELEHTWKIPAKIKQIPIAALNQAETIELIGSVAQGKLSALELQEILKRAEGIPLYAAELTRNALVKTGASNTNTAQEDPQPINNRLANNDQQATPTDTKEVPDSLRNIFLARLDKLDHLKSFALICAVIGREFERELLALVVNQNPATVQRSLDSLVSIHLVEIVEDRITPTFRFHHALLRDAAYSQLVKSDRSAIHRNVAQVLVEHYPQTINHHPERIAHHLSEGEDYQAAVQQWLTAADNALMTGALQETLSHTNRGQELLTKITDESVRNQLELKLIMAAGPALTALRGYSYSGLAQGYKRAQDICKQTNATEELIPVLEGLMSYYTVNAQYAVSQDLGRQLQALWRQNPTTGLEVEWRWRHGISHLYGGEIDEALACMEPALSVYSPTDHGHHGRIYGQDPGCAAMTHIALGSVISGKYAYSREMRKRALQIAEELGHPFTLAQAHSFDTSCLGFEQEVEVILQNTPQRLRYASDQLFPVWQGLEQMDYGWALCKTGDARGLQLMTSGYDTWSGTGVLSSRSHYLPRIAEANLFLGRIDQGLNAIENVIQHKAHVSDRLYNAEHYAIEARLLAALDIEQHHRRARELYLEGIANANQYGAHHYSLTSAMGFYELGQLMSEYEDEAASTLDEVLRLFADEPKIAILKTAHALLT